AELDDMWKKLLLNQFHDVLPGSSIEMVYEDAKAYYREIEVNGTRLREEALDVLEGSLDFGPMSLRPGVIAVNTTSWPRPPEVKEINIKDLGLEGHSWLQKSSDGVKGLLLVNEIRPMSVTIANTNTSFFAFPTVSATEVTLEDFEVINDDGFVEVDATAQKRFILENNYLKVTMDGFGRIISLIDIAEARESIPKGQTANVFRLFDDICSYWDAWD
ncbi:Alpha-mannosidase 2C1, partial [Dinochytrium kinnereticum]